MPETFTLETAIWGTATISSDGLYRYDLTRFWGTQADPSHVCFVMLNPSQADATKPDPTTTRCLNFARAWGYDGLVIVNLFAFRSAEPNLLRGAIDPIGFDNDRFIRRHVKNSARVVCAWGAGGGLMGQDKHVLQLIRTITTPYCLKLTKEGHPQHPLYLKADATPFPMPE